MAENKHISGKTKGTGQPRASVTIPPGKPDLAFPSFRKVIFVTGSFWHLHDAQ